jgi:hypothetical protein
LGVISPAGGLLRRASLASVISGKIRKMTNSDFSAYFDQFLKSLFCDLIPRLKMVKKKNKSELGSFTSAAGITEDNLAKNELQGLENVANGLILDIYHYVREKARVKKYTHVTVCITATPH